MLLLVCTYTENYDILNDVWWNVIKQIDTLLVVTRGAEINLKQIFLKMDYIQQFMN